MTHFPSPPKKNGSLESVSLFFIFFCRLKCVVGSKDLEKRKRKGLFHSYMPLLLLFFLNAEALTPIFAFALNRTKREGEKKETKGAMQSCRCGVSAVRVRRLCGTGMPRRKLGDKPAFAYLFFSYVRVHEKTAQQDTFSVAHAEHFFLLLLFCLNLKLLMRSCISVLWL